MFQHGGLRILTITLCSALIWGFVFLISLAGFLFFKNIRGFALTGEITGLVLDPLFFSLGILLVFSTGLILYSSLFAKAESGFLLCTPAAADQVFAYKYQGALAFSSWGFLLLGSPILIAYGIAADVPWYFHALLPLFFLGFVMLPSCVGALLCLLIVNYVPRHRKELFLTGGFLLLLAAGAWGYRMAHTARPENWNRDLTYHLKDQLALTQAPIVPSYWLCADCARRPGAILPIRDTI